MSGAGMPPSRTAGAVPTTLVTGPTAGAREQLIAAQLAPGSRRRLRRPARRLA